MKKIIWIVIIVVVGGIIWSVSDKSTPTVNAEPIRIGFVAALSGVGASIGEEERKGAELAVLWINDDGGVLGRHLQLVAEDVSIDKLRVAGSAVQKLINVDKVMAIVGPQWDEPAAAVAPIIEGAMVPMVSQNVTNDLEADKDFTYFFSTWYDNRVGIHMILKYAQQKGWKNIAIIRPVAAGFWEFASNLFKNYAPQYGITIIDDIDLGNPMTTDFRTPLLKLKSKNPQAIFVVTSDPVECPMMTQIKELGLVASVLSTESAGNQAALANCPAVLENLYFSTPRQQDSYQKFAQKFEMEYGAPPQFPSAVTAYDAVYVIAHALQKTKGESGDKLRQAIAETSNLPGASLPSISLDAKGFVITPDDAFEMQTVRDGKFVKAE